MLSYGSCCDNRFIVLRPSKGTNPYKALMFQRHSDVLQRPHALTHRCAVPLLPAGLQRKRPVFFTIPAPAVRSGRTGMGGVWRNAAIEPRLIRLAGSKQPIVVAEIDQSFLALLSERLIAVSRHFEITVGARSERKQEPGRIRLHAPRPPEVARTHADTAPSISQGAADEHLLRFPTGNRSRP